MLRLLSMTMPQSEELASCKRWCTLSCKVEGMIPPAAHLPLRWGTNGAPFRGYADTGTLLVASSTALRPRICSAWSLAIDAVPPPLMARIGFTQPLTLQHHPNFREYTIAQSNSELELSDTDADFPEFIAGDHFSSLHQFSSGGLPDTDSDSADFSDARSQPGEPQSPGGQQLPKDLYLIRSEEPALSLLNAYHHAVQARVCQKHLVHASSAHIRVDVGSKASYRPV